MHGPEFMETKFNQSHPDLSNGETVDLPSD